MNKWRSLYFGFAVVAAYAVLEWLLKGRLATALVATALMIWLVIDDVRAHPDYLAYFTRSLAVNQSGC